jgi:serine/threonine protein kinase/Tol biopolymer transport system component
MELSAQSEPRVRFEEFELNLHTRELQAKGRRLVLQEQPFQILATLLERPGHLVNRDELRQRLWSSDTFVDFERGLNKAVNRLREVLDDSADQPRFIETLPRQGYRFIAPVERTETQSSVVLGNLVGKRVSHYRVLEILGGGGMGVVYKAEDLKLGRQVALKFLPEELGKDAKALERFEREARAASALDHPNICAIHEFGDHDGQPFMVMPLLEGQTLRDRIAARAAPFTTTELLKVVLQIVEGLEAAHEKGIIHRDVKPANIFVTNRGEAKILDFGLAKLPHLGDPEALGYQEMPGGLTTHLSLTRTGVALGTAAYMSPEQVRGEKLDARTDLFSFGLVLYEIATGQQAFSGETAAVLHEAILHRTPVPARGLNPELPPRLENVINKALEKDREQRYQTASDMRADLEKLKEHAEPRSVGARWWVAGVSVLALLVVAGAIFRFPNRRPLPSAGLPDLRQRQLTDNSDDNPVASGASSPDGKYLAYADLKGIHIKLIETGEKTDVPPPEELKDVRVSWGIVFTWVRDGTRFIANAYMPGRHSSIWSVPARGGAPHMIRDNAEAQTVSRDGSWVAFLANWGRWGYREIWVMRPDGSGAHKLYDTDESSAFAGAEWSPDGQRLGYVILHEASDKGEMAIESRDLKGGPAVTMLVDAAPSGTWSWLPDGRIVYSWDEGGPPSETCNLRSEQIDLRTGKPSEKPRRLTNWAGFCLDNPSPSADSKRLVFRRWAWHANVYVADLDPAGTHLTIPRRLTLNEGRNFPAAWTPDSKVVIFESYRDRQWRMLKQLLDRGTAEPLVTVKDQMFNAQARVSPDGTWILYPAVYSSVGGTSAPYQLLRVPINGGRPEQVLRASFYDSPQSRTAPGCARAPASVCAIAERSSDGKQIIFTAFDPLKGRGREITRVDVEPTGRGYVWDLSPDGTRVALLQFFGEQSGQSPAGKQIRVIPLNSQPSQEIVVKGWDNLQSVDWAADGKALFVSGATREGSALLHVDLHGNARVLWERKGGVEPWFALAPWAVPSPDGRHLAIYDWQQSANMWMMENF